MVCGLFNESLKVPPVGPGVSMAKLAGYGSIAVDVFEIWHISPADPARVGTPWRLSDKCPMQESPFWFRYNPFI
tara:strand:+ start:125 stop:346 length:222 start_codon:yes stop_codon:yes gene_type:complete